MVLSNQPDAKEILVTTTPASAPAEPGATGDSPLRKPLALAAGVCVAVLLVGGGIGYLAGHHSGSSASSPASSPTGARASPGRPRTAATDAALRRWTDRAHPPRTGGEGAVSSSAGRLCRRLRPARRRAISATSASVPNERPPTATT